VREQLPTHRESIDLLVKAGCSQSVINHCRVVSALATRIARRFEDKGCRVDVQLVEIGGFLHDIGRSKTHVIDHALVGAEIARQLGLPNEIALIIERHIGGGISKEESKLLGWPSRNFLPQTMEEKIVCYADKRVAGSGVVSIEQTINSYIANLGENHPAVKRIRKLHSEICGLIGNLDDICNSS
jgi:uncharacterized protein